MKPFTGAAQWAAGWGRAELPLGFLRFLLVAGALLTEAAIPGMAQVLPSYHFCGNCQTNLLTKRDSGTSSSASRLAAQGIKPAAFTPYRAIGSKNVLIMRVDFPDLPGTGPTLAAITNRVAEVQGFFRTNSYNQLFLDTVAITSLLRMPNTSASYSSQGNGPGSSLLYADADAAARASGTDPAAYDFRVVVFSEAVGFGYGGFGNVGGPVSWLPGSNLGAWEHEMGHNLGLGHPAGWDSSTVIGTGIDDRHWYDVMGGGWGNQVGFTAHFRNLLGWLPDSAVHVATASGTYRIYAVDANVTLDNTRKYALRIPAGVTNAGMLPSDYWVECRQISGGHANTTNGVLISWANSDGGGQHKLLDTTPGSINGSSDGLDSALVLGRSLTDIQKQITIAPLNRAGTGSDTYVDVQVTLNSAIIPPAITQQPQTQSVQVGDAVNLNVIVSSTVPVTYQWKRYGVPITGATNASLAIGKTALTDSGEYFVVAQSSLGAFESDAATLLVSNPPINNALPQLPGMLAWWTADGSMLDGAGTNHGTLQGAPSFETGQFDRAFDFFIRSDGKFSTVTVPDSPLWSFGTGNFTVELWANFSSTSSDQAFVAHDEGGGTTRKWIFWRRSGALGFHLGDGTGASAFLGSTPFAPSLGQWYHLGVVREGNQFSFLINGAVVSTAASSLPIADASAPLTLGSAEGSFAFNGLMDEVRIYNRALSVSEFQSIYATGTNGNTPPVLAGTTARWAGNGDASDAVGTNHGTFGGPAYTTGKVGQGLSLNGSTAFVSVPDSPAWNFGTNEFSIELWANFAAIGDSPTFIASDNGGGNTEKWIWWLNDGELRFYCASPSLGYAAHFANALFQPILGRWYHLAITRQGANWQSYIDGVPVGSTVSPASVPNPSKALTIGQAEGGFFFNGLLDDIRIYNRALTAGELESIYRAGTNGLYPYSVGPPVFFEQPVAQTLSAGATARLAVSVAGSGPISYQWRKNGTQILGATNSMLTLSSAQTNDSGNYSASATSILGTATSQSATLTVTNSSAAPGAVPMPAGLLSWWDADGTPNDRIGLNHGILRNGTGYLPARGGQAFVIDGLDDFVSIPSTPSLSLTSGAPFTLEAWIFRASSSLPFHVMGKRDTTANYAYQMGYDGSDAVVPTNSWVHLADTYDGVTYRRYLNGVLAKSSSQPATTNAPTTADLRIGFSGPYGGFSGLIDDVRIYGRTLTAAEIQAISAAGTNGLGPSAPPVIIAQPTSQSIVAGGNVTFGVTATGSTPLVFQWAKDGVPLSSATNSTLIINNAQAGHAGNYSVTVTNFLGNVASSNAALAVTSGAVSIPTGLLDWWTGDGHAFDTIGTNHGTLQGVTAYVSGLVGQAFAVNGSYVSIPNSPSLNFTSGTPYTLEAWVYRTNNSLPFHVLGKRDATSAYFYQMGYDGSDAPVSANVWTHLADTYDGVTIRRYYNGTLVKNTASAPVTNTPTTAEFRIGFSGPFGGFSGLIDDVRIYNRALAETELQVIAAAGANGMVLPGNPPAITAQPANQSVVAGTSATFTVGVTGTAPLSYQWRFNGTNLAGATAASYTRSNVQTNHAGSYDVVVSNVAGSATSAAAVLTVSDAPVAPSITGQPAGQTVVAGTNVTLSVTATGTVPLNYQWRSNGVALAGATNATLVFNNIQTNAAATYSVVITNSVGSVTSGNAVLVVNAPPAITTQPVSQSVVAGNNVTFAVAATGTVPLSYQWRFNGTNLAGATTASYTLANVQVGQAGNYSVVVTNVAGSAVSAAAVLTVLVPPSIVGQPQDVTAALGTVATFSVGLDGSPPFTYQWRRSGTNLPAATNTTLVLSNVQVADQAGYSVAVSNAAGFATSGTAMLTVLTPPTILAHPQGTNGLVGSNVAFTVSVAGATPFFYQWFKDGSALPGETSSTLGIIGITTNHAGNYTVLVTNTLGGVLSAPALLSVRRPPFIAVQPQSQVVTVGFGLTMGVTVGGDAPLTYQWRRNGTNLSGASFNPLALNGISTNDAGSYTVVITNAYGAVTSAPAVVSVVVPTPPGIVTNLESRTAVVGTSVTLQVVASGSPPLNYQWIKSGSAIPGNDLPSLTFTNVSLADAGSYYVQVFNSSGFTNSAVATLTVHSLPSFTTQPQPAAVTPGNAAVFTVAVDGFPTPALSWFKDGIRLTNSAGISGATTATLLAFVSGTNQAGSYFAVATNAAGSTTSSVVALTVLLPPSITTHPRNVLLLRTNPASVLPATLNVVATGTAPLLYQWRFNGSDVSGATNPAFNLANVMRVDNGLYSVVVTNIVGTAISSNALLRVRVPQRLALPERLPDGRMRLVFLDDLGGMPGTNDLPFVEVQFATNLLATNVLWQRLTNALTVTNGMLLLDEPPGTTGPRRFYRVIER